MRLLLEHRVSPVPVRAAALSRAVEGGWLTTTRLLFDHVGPSAVLRHADSCIVTAAQHGHVDCLRFLLDALQREAGAAPLLEEGKRQALEAALTQHHYTCASELVLAGTVVDDHVMARTAWGGPSRRPRGSGQGAGGSQPGGEGEVGGGLADDLWGLFESGEQNDVVLVLPTGERFAAHRCVLAARSDKLRAMLLGGSSSFHEASAFEIAIQHPWTPSVFGLLLRYLYTGRALAMGHDAQETVELLVLADEYLCPRLRQQCEHVLGSQLDIGHVDEAMQLSQSLGGLQDLERYCQLIVSACQDEAVRAKWLSLVLTAPQSEEEVLTRLSRSACLDTGAVPPPHEWHGHPFSAKLEAVLRAKPLTYGDMEAVMRDPSALCHVGITEALGRDLQLAWRATTRAWAERGEVDRLTNAEMLRADLTKMLMTGGDSGGGCHVHATRGHTL